MCRVLVEYDADVTGYNEELCEETMDVEALDFDICSKADDDDIMYSAYGYMTRNDFYIWHTAYRVQKMEHGKWYNVNWTLDSD